MKKEKSIQYILTPIIVVENKKLDFKGLYRALLDERDKDTTAWKNFDFNSGNFKFDEKDELQKYSLEYEIPCNSCDRFYFVMGQKGLFLKISENAEFSRVNEFLARYASFIEFVKAYLFTPIGVAHYSDGDYYLRNDDDIFSSKRARVSYEIFDNEEVKN